MFEGTRHGLCRKLAAAAMVAALPGLAGDALAQGSGSPHHVGVDIHNGEARKAPRADGHGPIGVMGDHRHHKGELMLSVRYMRMWMEGNRIGEADVSPEAIVTSVPNRFFGRRGQPPTLRVVPTEMSMDMYMAGAMYGVTDRVTLMAMVPYVRKEMDHITFRGPRGTVRRGEFTTDSSGFGDVSTSAIIGLFDHERQNGETHLNLLMGVSAPTGSITRTGQVLTPTGARPVQRLPYAMQIGSGTWDLLPGAVLTNRWGNVSFGVQYRGTLRTGTNDEHYSLGDVHAATGWLQYQWQPGFSTSVRLAGQTQDAIDGIDPLIVAPVQTADPTNYGGDRVDLLFGVNLVGQRGEICGHRLALEAGAPVHQDLNGPQMKTDWMFTIGWQKTLGDC